MSDTKVGDFFDLLAGDYTETIERCFPRYREMLWGVLDYLPRGQQFHSILELGCGTGNLSVLLRKYYPDAKLQLVDISADSLTALQDRLGGPSDDLVFTQQDFELLDYPRGSFDLVVSSISIHHLKSAGKQELFAKAFNWLTDDGVLTFADQCAGATDDLYRRHIENWKEISQAAGSTTQEWEMWMKHQNAHDYHDTLTDQISWLRDAGFVTVDCVWRYLLWAVVQARKS